MSKEQQNKAYVSGDYSFSGNYSGMPSQHGKDHVSEEYHHHHSHAEGMKHVGGHHMLQVEDLTVSFKMYEDSGEGKRSLKSFLSASQHTVEVVRNLSISVHVGEIIAIVGASGSGKTLLADSIMGIFEPNSNVTGKIWFDGELQTAETLRQLRGNGISLIPQGVDSLDPLMRVGKQVLGRHGKSGVAQMRNLFERYGLGEHVEDLYPFELSGGMARRVLLCCALMDRPKVIIADEPTPGLDLELAIKAMDDLRDFADNGGSVLLITHDIELALGVADRIAVFKDGTVLEETSVENFKDPEKLTHPFSRELVSALPQNDFMSAHNSGTIS